MPAEEPSNYNYNYENYDYQNSYSSLYDYDIDGGLPWRDKQPVKKIKSIKTFRLNKSIYLAITVMFLLGIFYISFGARATSQGAQVKELQQEIAQLETNNHRVALEIESLQSLGRIEKIAVGDLGMVQPTTIKYVPINNADGSLNNENANNQQQNAVAENNNTTKKNDQNLWDALQKQVIKGKDAVVEFTQNSIVKIQEFIK